jgi:hypothetical protein
MVCCVSSRGQSVALASVHMHVCTVDLGGTARRNPVPVLIETPSGTASARQTVPAATSGRMAGAPPGDASVCACE